MIYADGQITVHHGDALTALRILPDCSVDAVVTDPPYGLEFMGREWDSFKPSAARIRTRADQRTNPGDGKSVTSTPEAYVAGMPYQLWCQAWAAECLRLLKPGGHLLAFGGTRTSHRLVCAIEDAGFEIRDSIVWLYGSGFPKSLSLYRSTMGSLCRSHELASHAVRISPWHPVESPAARAPTALALAETQPAGDLVLLTATGGAGDSSEVTATWLSDSPTGDTNWNTVSSWRGYSADRWAPVSTSIIETASRTTTASRTSNSSRSSNTPPSTTTAASRPDGCECSAVTVVASSTGSDHGSSVILIPTAVAPAFAPLAPLSGLGSAIKPAHEPIVVARKPLAGTVAANVLQWGTGALNVAGCRVEHASDADLSTSLAKNPGRSDRVTSGTYGADRPQQSVNLAGRWPTNVCLDGEAAAELDRQSGTLHTQRPTNPSQMRSSHFGGGRVTERQNHYDDTTTGASRFFPVFRYEPKAPTAERPRVNGAGATGRVAGTPARTGRRCNVCGNRTVPPGGKPWPACGHEDWTAFATEERAGEVIAHPTVKPLDLMRWLVRLITPPDGLVLDPFAGSGTTGEACLIEGFRAILVEREDAYLPLIHARLTKPIQPTLSCCV